MAILGIYSLVSYSVRQRRVEIGTRLALGANRSDVQFLIVGAGLKMALYGIAFGCIVVIPAVWLLLRAFKINDLTFAPFVSASALVAGIASVAAFVPAWRASLISPMVAIRDEPGSPWRSARESIRQAIKRISEPGDAPGGALITGFVEAARLANSSALEIALAAVSDTLGLVSAMVMEKTSALDYRCVAATTEWKSPEWSLPAQGVLLHRLRSYFSPLALNDSDFDVWLRWAEANAPKYVTEIQTLKRSKIRIVVALRTKNDIPGLLLLGPPTGRDAYTRTEKQILRQYSEQFALMMENARLTHRVVEQERLRRDLALAAEVQRRLLPEQPPESSFAEFEAKSVPARTVGGDYYDFLDLGDRRIAIALADVAGKGIAAALIMSVVQASLRIISAEGNISLPQLATKMNDFLHRSTPPFSYATFFYAQIDEQNRRLRYVNAGHNPPYLVHSDSTIQELAASGSVLGLFPQMSYEDAAIDLKSGDTLLAFTDGVTEAHNPSDEEFGEERLKALLLEVAPLRAAEISSRISGELTNWIQNAEQYDDITFVVMKIK
jgi:serine phosphatase RsbU (regulator of sigma subunit)